MGGMKTAVERRKRPTRDWSQRCKYKAKQYIEAQNEKGTCKIIVTDINDFGVNKKLFWK